MDKRGIELTTNEVIGIVLVLLFIFILGGCVFRIASNKSCPAGYDVIDRSEFNPSIASICGEEDSEDAICCSRKSDPLQVCKYYKEEKELNCDKLVVFNLNNVCDDKTVCGASTLSCSGAYCEKGLCFVKDGIGKCVDTFEIEGKRIIVNKNSCEKEFYRDNVGSSCEEGKHCVFDSFSRNGKCLG